MDLGGKLFISVLTFFSLTLGSQGQESIAVIQGSLTAITSSIRAWKSDSTDTILKIRTRDEKGLIHAQDLEPLVFTNYGIKTRAEDQLWQRDGKYFPKLPIQQLSIAPPNNSILEKNGGYISKALDGQGFSNINPADPSIAVGPNHVIQMINGPNGSALFSIYDKSGKMVFPQAYMDQLPGSSYNGGGDCIAWYDQLADRFVMSEFGDSSRTGIKINTLIMAVSVTNDPTGSWYVYEFFCDSFFPDYPKYSNWHDAWYGVTRDFSDQYLGNSVWAFDKQKMMAGAPSPTVQRLRMTNPDNKYNALVPVTLAGTEKPIPGTPGIFLYYSDDELTASASDKDSIGMISFKVDFNDPTRSVVRTETNFAVAAFNSMVCESRNCAPSSSGMGYDVVSNRIMHKPSFRNFGSYQSIVANHTVDVNGNNLSGIRWYELRKNSSWELKQQGTYSPQLASVCSPNNLVHRFMGSILQNGKGQIVLAYNFSSKSDDASLAFTGRNQNDPSNMMAYEEILIKKGTGYGTIASRWGDYNDIAPDPSNDSIFWFTGMAGNTASTWSTSIAALALSDNLNIDAKLATIAYPNSCEPICSTVFQPKIMIKNNGKETLTTMKILVFMNGIKRKEQTWTGKLMAAEETLFSLEEMDFPTGKTTLELVLDLPNGKQDEKPVNDSSSVIVEIKPLQDLPLVETAESAAMPPNGWFFKTNGSSSLGWKNSSIGAFEGSRSFVFDNFNNNEKGKYADLISPVLNTNPYDTLTMEFMLAAALYDEINQDSLEIWVSTDCGKTVIPVYKKWGNALATKPGFTITSFVPAQSEWRKEKIDLGRFSGKNIQVVMRGINEYGNNLYIDNIKIDGINFSSTEVQADSIIAPALLGCDPVIMPVARFTSLGKDTLKSVDVQLWSNGNLLETKRWMGKINRNNAASLSFSAMSLSHGTNNINMVLVNPNGKKDLNEFNDTVGTEHTFLKALDIPFRETFENNKTWPIFPIFSADRWQRISLSGAGAVMVSNNFRRNPFVSGMVSPLFAKGNPDSVYLNVDVAANHVNSLQTDTLELDLSTDCGKTWTSIYKKWGAALGTVQKNESQPFEPVNANEWRKEKVDLTSWLKGKSTFLFRIINKGSGFNNLFIDNVDIKAVYLPQRLKDQGHLLYPNPALTRSVVKFYPYTTDLMSIQLTDAKGNRVKTYQYKEGQMKQDQELDLTGLPAGVYFVKLIFRDRTVVEKLVKTIH